MIGYNICGNWIKMLQITRSIIHNFRDLTGDSIIRHLILDNFKKDYV